MFVAELFEELDASSKDGNASAQSPSVPIARPKPKSEYAPHHRSPCSRWSTKALRIGAERSRCPRRPMRGRQDRSAPSRAPASAAHRPRLHARADDDPPSHGPAATRTTRTPHTARAPHHRVPPARSGRGLRERCRARVRDGRATRSIPPEDAVPLLGQLRKNRMIPATSSASPDASNRSSANPRIVSYIQSRPSVRRMRLFSREEAGVSRAPGRPGARARLGEGPAGRGPDDSWCPSSREMVEVPEGPAPTACEVRLPWRRPASIDRSSAMGSIDDEELGAWFNGVLTRHPGGAGGRSDRERFLELFEGRGLADVGSLSPITEDTVFRVGSITKLFTALAVMQLGRGRARRPRRARERVPARLSADPRPSSSTQVTLRHLLTHTAGSPRSGTSST